MNTNTQGINPMLMNKQWTPEHIREWLIYMNYRHDDAAEAMEVTSKTIQRWANGTSKFDKQTIMACKYLMVVKAQADAVAAKKAAAAVG